MDQIIQREEVSLRSKMKEIIRELIVRSFFKFSEFFSLRIKSKLEVVTGFIAILELAKLKKVRLEQRRHFSEIYIHKAGIELTELQDDYDTIENQV
jgi:segregation and condensation protein A